MHQWPTTESLAWSPWLSPRTFRDLPVHRWYVFPHSFSPELFDALAEEWRLGPSDHLLDPFVGSGTTALSAQGRGIRCTGFDLSPLAQFVSAAKCAAPSSSEAGRARDILLADVSSPDLERLSVFTDPMLHHAFGVERLAKLLTLAWRIRHGDLTQSCRSFLLLALLHVVPRFALAERNGGWLRWRSEAGPASEIEPAFAAQLSTMIADLVDGDAPGVFSHIETADARSLPSPAESFTAVLTSPPYPNRHDYTRIFGLELLLFFLDASQTRSLRRQSFESHPEARPVRCSAEDYTPPDSLDSVLCELKSPRIQRMLKGYFLDLHLSLREIARVLKPGSPAALVVGNAQYEGHPLLVDELTAEIGEGVGLECTEIRIVRFRGNSAQQMGRHGRNPSRESVVFFRRRGCTKSVR